MKLKKLKKNINYRQNQKIKTGLIYFAAAAIFALFFINTFFFKKESNHELFSFYLQKTGLTSLVKRGDDDVTLSKIQILFDNKNYKEAETILINKIDSIKNGNVYIYLAISQIELEKYSKAEKTLNSFIKKQFIDSEKGYWYKSLLYLKSNEIEKVKKELKTIIDKSYYNKALAEELLDKLE